MISKSVTIMRGIPGSGKSSWIKLNKPKAEVHSTDNYFMNNGKYEFSPSLLATNHNLCLKHYIFDLSIGVIDIVVDNTNISLFEIAPFYRAAEAYGYSVKVIWLQCPWEIAAQRNIHAVPTEVIRKMSLSFEPLPPWCNVEILHYDGGFR